MDTDLATKVLLAGILLCLLLLVVQGFGSTDGAQAGRYQMERLATPDGPMMLRTDTATGQFWRTEGFSDDPRWVRVEEP